jgi:hypothetical protein
MPAIQCPICVSSPLDAPRRAGGKWFAMCARCHGESEVELYARPEDARLAFRVPGALSAAARQATELHRRRTCF